MKKRPFISSLLALLVSAFVGSTSYARPFAIQTHADTNALEVNAEVSILESIQHNLKTMTLLNLYQANKLEIKLASLALKKASREEVREYARKLISDHSKANDQVEALAKKENISLVPQGLARATLAMNNLDNMLAELSMLSNVEFDRAFLNTMIILHIKDISQQLGAKLLLKKGSVERLVDSILPTLLLHLVEARNLKIKIQEGE